jgi:hypothetical protein
MMVIAKRLITFGRSFQNATIVSLMSESAWYFSYKNTKTLKILKDSKYSKLALSVSPGMMERISITKTKT